MVFNELYIIYKHGLNNVNKIKLLAFRFHVFVENNV